MLTIYVELKFNFSVFDENKRLNEEAKKNSDPFAHTFWRTEEEVNFDLHVIVKDTTMTFILMLRASLLNGVNQ